MLLTIQEFCNEIIKINVIDSTSTNILSNVRKNPDHKTGYYIRHTVLLVVILQFITAIFCYDCLNHRSNDKRLEALKI